MESRRSLSRYRNPSSDSCGSLSSTYSSVVGNNVRNYTCWITASFFGAIFVSLSLTLFYVIRLRGHFLAIRYPPALPIPLCKSISAWNNSSYKICWSSDAEVVRCSDQVPSPGGHHFVWITIFCFIVHNSRGAADYSHIIPASFVVSPALYYNIPPRFRSYQTSWELSGEQSSSCLSQADRVTLSTLSSLTLNYW